MNSRDCIISDPSNGWGNSLWRMRWKTMIMMRSSTGGDPESTMAVRQFKVSVGKEEKDGVERSPAMVVETSGRSKWVEVLGLALRLRRVSIQR